MNKVVILMVFSLFLAGIVNAITEDERAFIQEGLNRYADDPVKMGAFISVVDGKFDLSNENQLRQEIISKAESISLNEASYTNIKAGKAPEVKGLIIETEEGERVETPASTSGTDTIFDREDSAESGSNLGIAIIVLIIIIIIVLVILYLLKRNKV